MPIIVDEEAVKNAYEHFIMIGEVLAAEGAAEAVWSALLDDVKYALANPGSQRAAVLMRALGRRDALNAPLGVEAPGR